MPVDVFDADAIKAVVEAAAARLMQAQGTLASAEQTLARSRALLAKHEVRAPFAGVITSKDAQPGEIISPAAAGGGFTRTGICTIVDMNSLEVEFLFMTNFTLFVPTEQYRQYYKELCNHAKNSSECLCTAHRYI
jgi:multidrug efflux pump subunit AcrA (membrane-fusion protein)